MTIPISDYWGKFVFDGSTIGSKKCKFYTRQNSVILDCDAIKKLENTREPINDFIAFEKTDLYHVGIIEFKGNSPDYSRAMAQFHYGKITAERIIKESGIKGESKMYMILVSPSKTNSNMMLPLLKKESQKMGAQFEPASCYTWFHQIIKKHSASPRNAQRRKF